MQEASGEREIFQGVSSIAAPSSTPHDNAMAPRKSSNANSRKLEQSHAKLDMRLFEADCLRDDGAREHANSVFERHLQISADRVHTTIQQLLDRPNLLEYLLSSEYVVFVRLTQRPIAPLQL